MIPASIESVQTTTVSSRHTSDSAKSKSPHTKQKNPTWSPQSLPHPPSPPGGGGEVKLQVWIRSSIAWSGWSRPVVVVAVVWCRGQSRYSCMMGYRYVIRSFSHMDGGCTTMYVDTVWGLLLKDIAHASVPLNASPPPPSPLSSLFPLSSSSLV